MALTRGLLSAIKYEQVITYCGVFGLIANWMNPLDGCNNLRYYMLKLQPEMPGIQLADSTWKIVTNI